MPSWVCLSKRRLLLSSLCWRLRVVCLQGEAIAYNLREMFGLRVPVISVVIGEGGSGGALAIGCANRNLIMENAVYYVASPEACAAILWKSRAASSQVGGVCVVDNGTAMVCVCVCETDTRGTVACGSRGTVGPWGSALIRVLPRAAAAVPAAVPPQATEALRITAPELIKLEVMDEVIPEPLGGAHRSAQQQQQPHTSQHARATAQLHPHTGGLQVCRQPPCVGRLQVCGIGATTTC